MSSKNPTARAAGPFYWALELGAESTADLCKICLKGLDST